MTTRVSRSRTVKRLNRRWPRQKPIERGGNDHDVTGAVAGTPGSFTPPDNTIPADLAALQALGDLGQTDAWTTGQSVVLGDESEAHWDGDSWAVGVAP